NCLHGSSRAYARENGRFSLCDARVHNSAAARPQLRAVSAYFVYKGFDRVDSRMGRDAMPEIEYVAGCRTERVKHVAHLLAHPRGRRDEHRWIEVALQRNARADSAACFARIDTPVQSNRFATACRNALQPSAAALGEHDARRF